MPPKKRTSTPNNPSDIPTWTLDEVEEMCKDIDDLQNKVVTKYELQRMTDSTKAKMESMMDTKMDGLK
jgi:phage I-like protein